MSRLQWGIPETSPAYLTYRTKFQSDPPYLVMVQLRRERPEYPSGPSLYSIELTFAQRESAEKPSTYGPGVHFGHYEKYTLKDGLDFAENWFFNDVLSPMEQLSVDLKSNPFRLKFRYADPRGGATHEAFHGDHTISLRLEPYWVDPKTLRARLTLLQSSRQSDVRAIETLRAQTGQTFKTNEEAFEFASNWFADRFLSPMELMSEDLAKLNPDFRLPFQKGAYSFYYEAKHKNHLVSAWVERLSDGYQLYKSEAITFSSDGQLSVRTAGPADLKFSTLPDALNHVSNWYANTYLSPMELLGLGLTSKENPRKPKYVPTRMSRGSR